ncbi:MAG: chromosomal replication initiator protein DnaA [Alphaproteobacteria bacterium]|nr:chromosomal replication initiator protein DnaA [Alphaproteobacteria bacterium]MBV9695265.1 chromosomal replication initiator protein DnaA [Alphaproteobacteria bacterium]
MVEIGGKTSGPEWPVVWAAARKRLRGELGDALFEAWIGPLTLEGHQRDEIRLGTPKAFICNWVTERYMSKIERALRAEGGEPSSVAVVVSRPQPVIGGNLPRSLPASPALDRSTADESRADAAVGLWTRMLHPKQTFESFVVGATNEFAHGAMKGYVEGRDSEVTHLFVHGGFGYGKTHLLNAAALEFRTRAKRTLFLRAEDFMRHFLGALHRRDTLAFKDELRTADVLIVDDLQHICRSTATASEFLYTVNAFADLHRRVIIAADRAPGALEGLGADVRSRLAGGLVVQLGRPDRETRLAILRRRALDFARLRPDVSLPETVLERIAEMEDVSPREMIGIFTRLATYADLTKKPVTLEMASEAVGAGLAPVGKTSIEDIQRKTAEYYKLDVREFSSPQRARRVARPRQVAMYLSRKLTTRSLPEIGRRFGGRDHTTVLHACRRVEALCLEDSAFRTEVDFLRSLLSRRTDV